VGFRLAAGLMAVLFVFSAAVQWNDPDPALWIALYGVAAVLAAAAALGTLPLPPNAAAAVLFTLLFLWWAPSLVGARAEAFESVEMQEAGDEEPREALGLLLCAAWSGAQSVAAWRRRDD